MAENEAVDRRKLLDVWDGPLVRPVPAEEESTTNVDEVPDQPEVSDKPHNSKARTVGAATLGGWSGGWED